ncbi:MAG: UDP-N-acetylglucosamine 2-epimerase (non-hydrolyzing) [Acidobacteriota bacterium]|nr:UDP-N-acetylglucosamine 2-epimerase (non-hydrolyzing) [Acidobacteriota bacterium]MDH3786563.1 UDP-N-acetylglucosamine 2-epimerase (non-hydrolyzing) [Acidobacteriota bacterium]
MKVLTVVGARPNFMKAAPLVRALRRRGHRAPLLHTGQHYDAAMSQVFFDELGMPEPDVYLGVGSGSHAEQTAQVMLGFEPVCKEMAPDFVTVVGDVNSTVAAALVSAKLGYSLAHLEAGLRSFDWSMPEEINRVVTDRLSDWLLTHSPDADLNLKREGVPDRKIFRVGNIMIDSLVANLAKSRESTVLERLSLNPSGYGVVTLHRPSNVDSDDTLQGIIGALKTLAEELPLVFPCHPRTRKRIKALGLVDEAGAFQLTEPLGYLDFLKLVSDSRMVLSDSGGIQEETTYLGVPCITLRENTERPITIEQGTNVLAGADPARILAAARNALAIRERSTCAIEGWDGKTSDRIVDCFERWL